MHFHNSDAELRWKTLITDVTNKCNKESRWPTNEECSITFDNVCYSVINEVYKGLKPEILLQRITDLSDSIDCYTSILQQRFPGIKFIRVTNKQYYKYRTD